MPCGREKQLFGQALWALSDAVDAIGLGGILLAGSAEVLYVSTGARRHVGEHVALVQGRLAIRNRVAAKVLRDFLQAAQDERSGPVGRECVMKLPRDGQRPLIMRAFPIAADLPGLLDRAVALLILLDPDEHPCPTIGFLQQTLELTPGEAFVAVQLIRGDSLRQIAAARKVSMGTIRVQLKAIFAKTQTRRQSELVRLLARLATLAPSSAPPIKSPRHEQPGATLNGRKRGLTAGEEYSIGCRSSQYGG